MQLDKMKKRKYIFFIQAIFIVNTIVGQSYIPIPLFNTFWRVDAGGSDPSVGCAGCSFSYQYITDGDTVINSIFYTKIKVTGSQGCSAYNCSYSVQRGYRGAIRQDSTQKKVFVVFPNTSVEETLYDFSQNVGDTVKSVFNSYPYPILIIESIDSILIGTNYHKRFNISNNCYSYLIEGVGSTHGLLENMFCGIGIGSGLVCMNHNGQSLYPDNATACNMVGIEVNNFLKVGVFPNPFLDYFEIEFSQKYSNIEFVLYDVSSILKLKQNYNQIEKIKILREELPPGIYFYQLLVENKIMISGNIVAN